MKISKYFSFLWPILFLFLTFNYRKNRHNERLIKFFKEVYFGFDPFKYRGILTGIIYSVVDGYFTGMIIEYFINKRHKKLT